MGIDGYTTCIDEMRSIPLCSHITSLEKPNEIASSNRSDAG